jgi:esterase/lipase superfamily enzyme
VQVEERSWFSDALGQDMALRVYGHAGRPVVAFPSQDGRYRDVESWGMVEACARFIDEGRLRLIAVDLADPWCIDLLRQAKLAIVVGRGAWEDDMLADTRAMRDVLAAKGIPAIVDEWGDDVNHDWPWWRKMLPHYLDRLGV